MPAQVKANARELAGKWVKSGLAGLSAYFLALTLEALQPDDVLCYLLPGSWTDTHYGAPLRAAVAEASHREVGLVGFPSERQLFPGTRVTGMVLLVGPSTNQVMPLWSMGADITDGRVVVDGRVERARGAYPRDGFGGWLWPRTASVTRERVTLSTFARVRRGAATGANPFFMLNDAEAEGAPRAYLKAAVLSLRDVSGSTLDAAEHERIGKDGGRRWLLQLPPGIDFSGDAWLARWHEKALKAKVNTRYLTAHREPWYTVEHVEPPDVLLSPMGKRRMKAVGNGIKAIPSNAVYGLYFSQDGSQQAATVLSEWLNSEDGQTALHVHARAYGAGLFKLEPKDVRRVEVPIEVAERIGAVQLQLSRDGTTVKNEAVPDKVAPPST
jgi:hypothetical protein